MIIGILILDARSPFAREMLNTVSDASCVAIVQRADALFHVMASAGEEVAVDGLGLDDMTLIGAVIDQELNRLCPIAAAASGITPDAEQPIAAVLWSI